MAADVEKSERERDMEVGLGFKSIIRSNRKQQLR